jgi:hypothetical protein
VSVHRKPRAIRRRHSSRDELVRVLIVGEGRETEYNYFDSLRREDAVNERFFVTPKRGTGGSREQVAQFAIDRKRHDPDNYDLVFCVMDAERQTEPAHVQSLTNALRMLRQNRIYACLSNPSFEIWLNAHFERTCTPFINADAVIGRLDVHWNKHFGCNYDKACGANYRRLLSWRTAALRHARQARDDHGNPKKTTRSCNSSTDVYRLVGWLLGKRDSY